MFDFLGKDSIRYYNEVPVEKRVFKNLLLFKENKQGQDDLFDRLNVSHSIMSTPFAQANFISNRGSVSLVVAFSYFIFQFDLLEVVMSRHSPRSADCP